MMDIKDTLAALSEAATQGEWRLGADLMRIHPFNRDKSDYHRNGFAKTIASVGKEEGDWRGITQKVADAKLIVTLVNAYRAGQLVPVPSVVPANGSMCGGLYPVHGSVTHHRSIECCDFCSLPADYQPAVIAAMKEGQ